MAQQFSRESVVRGKLDLSVLARIRKIPAYMTDRSVGLIKKLGIVLGTLYVISPVDAISDFIPIVGWLDDVGVLGAMYLFMMKELGEYIVQHQPRSGNSIVEAGRKRPEHR